MPIQEDILAEEQLKMVYRCTPHHWHPEEGGGEGEGRGGEGREGEGRGGEEY